jgi:alpha-D-xyloside xylohydrolase
VTTAIDLTRIPVFVRAGSILPLDEAGVMTIRVYPGTDGEFTLYEDDGISNDYEKDKQSRIRLSWNNARGELTIGQREGSYEGMPAQKEMKIVVIGRQQKTVTYRNKEIKLKIEK